MFILTRYQPILTMHFAFIATEDIFVATTTRIVRQPRSISAFQRNWYGHQQEMRAALDHVPVQRRFPWYSPWGGGKDNFSPHVLVLKVTVIIHYSIRHLEPWPPLIVALMTNYYLQFSPCHPHFPEKTECSLFVLFLSSICGVVIEHAANLFEDFLEGFS